MYLGGVHTGSLLSYSIDGRGDTMHKRFPIKTSKNGLAYSYPEGMTEDQFYTMLDELINFCKIKGLTVSQALILLEVGADYLTDTTLV